MKTLMKRSTGLILMYLLLGVISGAELTTTLLAQEGAVQRQVRAYIPPDQLVSFLPSTPFDRFVEFLNPIFRRVAGKEIIDPESRKHPIGISISGLQFLDALELVLQYNSLQYRETERYFMIEKAPDQTLVQDADAATGRVNGVDPGTAIAPATLESNQIKIDAVLFELNHTRAKDSGIDWSVLLGSSGSAGGGGGQSAEGSQNSVSFLLNSKKVFGSNDYISTPQTIDFSDLNSLIRLAETQGVGETIASPNVTVQSGVEGRIQIGSDVPVQVRDFAGNAVTQFFSTGIIIKVTPVLITEPVADTLGAPTMDFIHLTVEVEKSGSRPSASGPIIDRSTAKTQVLLLDGEQTVIGGLYSTDQTATRTGVPVLKDLPGWFFGIRYLFGRTQEATTQKELLIVLQATVEEPLLARARRPISNDVLNARRLEVQKILKQFNGEYAKKIADENEFEKSKN